MTGVQTCALPICHGAFEPDVGYGQRSQLAARWKDLSTGIGRTASLDLGPPAVHYAAGGRQALGAAIPSNQVELVAKSYHQENIHRLLNADGGLHLPD